ncbi:MAG: methylated-DNA--[protein]-cysteine S-methyltransferase [ANME-2 cluster archaeon]|nr:methylated-DNA--[protein]-cysteine S-methyltransferase [ANME-2 cluster archaeon]
MSVDFFYAKPIGMWVAVVEDRGEVRSIHFMKNHKGERCVHHPVSLDMQRYFNGKMIDFSCYDVDLSGFTFFEQQVLRAARSIKWGSIITYSQLAKIIGRPGAIRAVGTALGKNRVPVVIPCHRVVSKHGPGGFSYGVDMKKRLLGIESIKV